MLLRTLLLAAAVASLCSVSAHAARIETHPSIVNGVFTSQQPTVAAVLKGTTAETATQFCTATLIGCQTILTAAHCVCDTDGVGCQPGGGHEPLPGRYFVFLQHAGLFNVDRVAVSPDYKGDVGDIAVLHLSTPVTGIAPTPINRTGTPPHGMAGTLVGFGRQGGSVSDYGLKRAGAITVGACPATVSNATSVCWDFNAPAGEPGTNSNTCHGDSGGPMFVDYGCGPVVSGVTTDGTNPDCTIGDHSWDVNVYAFRDFIDAAAQGDIGQEACGTGAQVGDANVTVVDHNDSLSVNLPSVTTVIDVPSDTGELRVTMNAVDGPSVFENFDLYVRAGALPTTTEYDCRANGSNQFGACVIPNPAAGAWYAIVRRVSGSGTYQLTATAFPTASTPRQPVTLTCNDGSICTSNDTCHAGQCVGEPTPLTACYHPAERSRSQLMVQNVTNNKRDALKWTATRLPLNASDLGDPTTDTAYEVCVFDEQGGAPHLALNALIPPGAGWVRTGKAITFRDLTGAHGGIRSLRLKTGVSAGSVHLRGAGAYLAPPTLPLDPLVSVQIGNGSACWETTLTRTQRSRSNRFRAVTPR